MDQDQLERKILLLERQLEETNKELHRKDRTIGVLEAALLALGHSLTEQSTKLRVCAKLLQGLQGVCRGTAEVLDGYATQIFAALNKETRNASNKGCSCKTD